ncbi:MAG: polynucleotide adenylyltransferase PcnB [Gammaproteobacteria bacterium]|nr:polynucleotide adenylyltransferase PcnB [Gammaproteobacteria bacterium]
MLHLIKKIFTPTAKHDAPITVARNEHHIAIEHISPSAIKVLTRLHEAGYAAYLVGGSVRDLLLGKRPKDFDVATNALPEEVKALFRNCRLIGQRFRLAHVFYGSEIIEVATFRASHDKGSKLEGHTHEGRIVRDNVYGTMEEDAWRRDFSINALYYNIADGAVVDYTGGMTDLKNRQLAIIGDPKTRYLEDPVRMLRAIRFASKLGLTIHKKTADAIAPNAKLLKKVASSRLFDEILKLFLTGHALDTFHSLQQFKLVDELLPATAASLANDTQNIFQNFIDLGLKNTDERVHEGKSVTPAFLLAVILWQPIQDVIAQLRRDRQPPAAALEAAISQVLHEQSQYISTPRRFTHSMRAIWTMQPLFFKRQGKRPFRMMEQPRFRAAFDFLLLRAQAGEKIDRVASWWQEFVDADDTKRESLIAQLPKRAKK